MRKEKKLEKKERKRQFFQPKIIQKKYQSNPTISSANNNKNKQEKHIAKNINTDSKATTKFKYKDVANKEKIVHR